MNLVGQCQNELLRSSDKSECALAMLGFQLEIAVYRETTEKAPRKICRRFVLSKGSHEISVILYCVQMPIEACCEIQIEVTVKKT